MAAELFGPGLVLGRVVASRRALAYGPRVAADDWAARLRAGDKDALTTVYREHLPAVRRLLASGFGYRSRKTGARQRLTVTSAFDRDELCQETFAELFRQFRSGSFDAARPVGPYVARIAMNLALRRMGRASRELLEAEPEPLETVPPPRAEDPERARLLAEFQASLSAEDRALLHGYFDDEASQEAVGAELGLSRDQVYRGIVRIRRRALEFFTAKGWLTPE